MQTIVLIFWISLLLVNPVYLNNVSFRASNVKNNVKNGEAPYQVLLVDDEDDFLCGGAILNRFFVLTAARCVDKFVFNFCFPIIPFKCSLFYSIDASDLWIKYNTLNKYSGFSVTVEKIYLHDQYESHPIKNDIALVKLSKALILGQTNARSISLPAPGTDLSVGQVMQVTGWRYDYDEFEYEYEQKYLWKANIVVVELSFCQSAYLLRNVTTDMICGSNKLGEWIGDIGGPAIYNNQMVGIVSGGHLGILTIFTRVSSYVTWISKIMSQTK